MRCAKNRCGRQTLSLETDKWERLQVATDQHTDRGAQVEELKRALVNLPFKYREALTLFYLGH